MQLYKLDFPNGKSYIGITNRTAETRFKAHCNPANNRYYCQNAIHKYGKENIVLTVLATVDNWELLCLAEQEAIEKFNTYAPNGMGYNLTLGGDGSIKINASSEDRVKMDKEYQKKYMKRYLVEKKESLAKKRKEYRENNKHILVKKQKDYALINKDKVKESKKVYALENREEILKKQSEYRKLHRDELNKKAKEYREKNKDRLSLYHKEYRESHSEQVSLAKKRCYEAKKQKL